ncbi:hypothetical protein ACVJMY_008475 [Bradyrhizobium diazoefficiens]
MQDAAGMKLESRPHFDDFAAALSSRTWITAMSSA